MMEPIQQSYLRLDIMKYIFDVLKDELVEEDEEIDLETIINNIKRLERYVVNGE